MIDEDDSLQEPPLSVLFINSQSTVYLTSFKMVELASKCKKYQKILKSFGKLYQWFFGLGEVASKPVCRC